MCPRNSPSLHSPLAMHLSTERENSHMANERERERENSQRAFISAEERATNFCCPSAEKVLAPRASKCARARPSSACLSSSRSTRVPTPPSTLVGCSRASVSPAPRLFIIRREKARCIPWDWCSSCSSWRCKARKRWLCFRCGEIAARASPAKTVGLPLHAALSSTPPRAAQTCSPPSDLPCRICRRPTVWTRSRKPTPLPVRCRRRCPTSKRACHRRRRRCQRACRRQMSRPMVQPKT